jgi:D-alanine transaminase
MSTVYLNGQYVPKSDAHISVEDRGFLFGDGIYEVVRAYAGRFFALDAHLSRLGRGLEQIEIRGVRATDFAEVCLRLLDLNDLATADAIVYMQVTRGAAPRRHWFPDPDTAPTTFAIASPFVPKGDPVRGASVITVPDVRWARCDIKSLNILPNCLANQRARSAGALEAIFVRDGVALEASASSFFGVFGGEVRTAPKTNYILPSITRDVALELCRTADIPVRETPIFASELASADELFLAGTTVEIMPIVHVDQQAVGDGKPGPITRKLNTLFTQRTGSPAMAGR